IDMEASEKILAAASSLYFPLRTYDRILEVAEDLDESQRESFKRFLREDERDLKRDDAIRALKRIKEIAG
ncbi:MAG TPA: TfuA-related McrA-glycine thioamidation protein, partial [Methanotrichaceae archaeon]|nr:TfuA-related McrA-glycine thioamidation protein [Methanotrichaceae archaeon]